MRGDHVRPARRRMLMLGVGLPLVLGLCLLLAVGACQKAASPADEDDPGTEAKPARPAAELFRDVTAASGVDFTYHNGQEAGHYAILETLGGGVALLDYDGDGLLDIFVTGGGSYGGPDKKQIKGHAGRLYKNLGNFKFKDVTREAGLDQPLCYSHGCAVADYDRDGWPDLLVTGYGRLALYHNEPVDPADPKKGRRFREVTKEAGLLSGDHSWSTSAAFADLDGDGWPDLYVCQYVDWSWANNPPCKGFRVGLTRDVCGPLSFTALPHAVYHNVPAAGGGRAFVNVSKPAGLRVPRAEADYAALTNLDEAAKDALRKADRDKDYGKGLGVIAVDLDEDGKPDLYVADDTSGNLLYINRSRPGQILLEEVGFARGAARDDAGIATGSMGVDAADYDGSGLASLWLTNYEGELHSLFRNLGPKERYYFHYQTPAAGIGALGNQYVGFGTAFLDLDNHGWEDLVVANGHVLRYPAKSRPRQRPVLLRNGGRGRFTDITARGGPYFRVDHLGRGLAVGDLNNDGLPDLVISHVNDPVAVLRNVAPRDHHWLGVELATADHRDFVGARLTLEAGGRRLRRFAKGGASYLSSSDRRFLFGLGGTTRVGTLTVEWPGGQPRRESWDGLAIDRYHRLVQGTGAARP